MEYTWLVFYFLNIWVIFSKFEFSKGNNDDNELCFSVIGDMGGIPNPPYSTASQKRVAKLLGKVTGKLKCKFIMGVGDNFYFDGVKNVNDPRFELTYERTYSDPALHVPWYMIAGNHDHLSNISAQIAYTKLSKRWHYPDYFYTESHKIPKSSKTLQIIMIDTMMLCFHNKRSGAPPPQVQLKWIDETLNKSKANYLVVGGHHPMYSAGTHGNTNCLHEKLKPLLEKYNVTVYFSGHDHNLQHIKDDNSSIHYFISGSGNFVDPRLTNKDKLPNNSLRFEHGSYGGFILVRVNNENLEAIITNSKPEKLYRIRIKPRVVEKYHSTVKRNMDIDFETSSIIKKMPDLLMPVENQANNPTEAVAFDNIKQVDSSISTYTTSTNNTKGEEESSLLQWGENSIR